MIGPPPACLRDLLEPSASGHLDAESRHSLHLLVADVEAQGRGAMSEALVTGYLDECLRQGAALHRHAAPRAAAGGARVKAGAKGA